MQKPPLNRTMKERASSMRRHMTKEEFHLWYHFLRMYPVKFRRQRVMGAFICDFYCHRARLIVELDGAQHYSDYGAMMHGAARSWKRMDARCFGFRMVIYMKGFMAYVS